MTLRMITFANDALKNDGMENDDIKNDYRENDGMENDCIETDSIETDGMENDCIETDSIETDGILRCRDRFPNGPFGERTLLKRGTGSDFRLEKRCLYPFLSRPFGEWILH